MKMAFSCCSKALFPLPHTDSRYGVVPSNAICPRQRSYRSGLLFRAERRIKPRRSTRVTCLGETNTSVVTGKSWDKLILNSETPVLVEFYTNWCGPCRMVHRVINEIATEYSGKVKFYLLDADHDLAVADKYEVKAVPVVMLFKDGEKRESIVGTMPKEFYVAAIEKVLAS